MRDRGFGDVPLPSSWAKNVKSAVLHVISLAHYAIGAVGHYGNIIDLQLRMGNLQLPCIPRL